MTTADPNTATTTAVAARADRRAASSFVIGAAATVVSGALVQMLVVPTTEVSNDRWSYPWKPGPFVVVSLFYVLLHLLVAVGLLAYGRAAMAGTSRPARIGNTLAVAGTLTLTAGELVGLPLADASTDATSAQAVGGIFGLGVLASAVGFLLLGAAMLKTTRRDRLRCAPLATGIWTTVLLVLPIAVPAALPGGVALYGAGLLAMAVALHRTTADRRSAGSLA